MADFWNPYASPEAKHARVLGFGSVLAVLIIWSVLSGFGLVGPTRLPAPWDVLKAFSYLAWYDGNSMLLTAALWSVGRLAVAGFFVILIGIPIGVAMGASPRVNAVLSPLVDEGGVSLHRRRRLSDSDGA